MASVSPWNPGLLISSPLQAAPASQTGSMELFGAAHLSVLVLTVVLTVLAIWGARAIRGSRAEHRLIRTCGWVFLVLSTAWLAWGWLPQNWVLEESLPLH